MQSYKLDAAKRAQKQLHGDYTFEHIVDQLKDLALQIQACYHKYLNFSDETLAWMMAIDASFLLEFLQIYAMNDDEFCDYRKAAHNVILRDLVMLENQIPLFVLRKVLEIQYSSPESADDMLMSMLKGFYTFVPKAEQKAEITEVDDQGEAMQPEEIYSDYTKRLINQLWKLLLSRVNKGPIKLIKKLVVSKPTKLLSKLPWKTLQDVVFPQQNVEKKSDDESSTSSEHMNKPPLVEEITIPSVTKLAKSNVRFLPTVGNISTVSFDAKKAILHLPTISLDVNTEVVLRNVVAYEASSASGPLVLTRYTELMNGIIDTEEDAKLLREKGVIVNR
ncbi:hypothetical protein WN944_022511 [Citrus x changshan-huyou]|uniref:Uncharacterized protein n=1 Tax=Citrus x changshan-huyou TaxID=2935761 RepID=A0AAP0MYQ2_9ROSI